MDKWEKRNLYILILIVILIGTGGSLWTVHHMKEEKYPRWTGMSEDGKWKAILAKNKNTASKDYFGKLYWNGDKKDMKHVYLTFAQFRVNGNYHTGDKKERMNKKEEIIPNPDVTGFVDFEPYNTINNKKLVVYLHWKKDHQTHHTKITLKKQTK